jgi:hypothetical protein
MNVDYESLNELFRRQDFLGLIAMGVPENEYEAQVHDILTVIDTLPHEEASIPRLVGIFEDVYRAKFGWDYTQMRRVRPDFEDIAQKVMNYFG